MSEEQRAPYLELEAQDRQRFEQESVQADAEAAAQVEARRAALQVQDGERHSSRGARQRVEAERSAKQEERERRRQSREAHMDPEELEERRRQRELQRQETQERRRKKQAEEKALAKQHHKLDREEQKKASQRLDYLLKQSSIFAKLQGGKGSIPHDHHQQQQQHREEKKIHHLHDQDSAESNEEEEEEEEAEAHMFLTQQPSCIEHGHLKPYQLEALNWMIHLAEKGLNGILADEVSLEKKFFNTKLFVLNSTFISLTASLSLSITLSSALDGAWKNITIHLLVWLDSSPQSPRL